MLQRSYTNKISKTWLPKRDLNDDYISWYINMHGKSHEIENQSLDLGVQRRKMNFINVLVSFYVAVKNILTKKTHKSKKIYFDLQLEVQSIIDKGIKHGSKSLKQLVTECPKLGNRERWIHAGIQLPSSPYIIENPSHRKTVAQSVGGFPISIYKSKTISHKNAQMHNSHGILDSIKLITLTITITQVLTKPDISEFTGNLLSVEDNEHFVSGQVLG